ncbi:MAG: TlpA family protein disulfide reductase [Chloroflexota bacterium]|nr:TlpA family protein disulfide reductase [Chloroflexota bacterium]
MVQPGAAAPDFTLPGLDGLEYALHEAVGKGPVLLAFWQKDCGTCKLAAPYLDRLYDAYENLTWSFWAICQNDAGGAASFVRQYGFRPTVLVDGPGLGVSRIYDPESTPTLYLIEPEQGVTLVSTGFAKDELNEISRRVAGYAGAEYVEVAPPGDGAPPFKPG